MFECAGEDGVGMIVDGFNQYAPHAAVDAGDGDFQCAHAVSLMIIVQFGLLFVRLGGFRWIFGWRRLLRGQGRRFQNKR